MEKVKEKVYQYNFTAIFAQLIITITCCLIHGSIGMMNIFMNIVIHSGDIDSNTFINRTDTSSIIVMDEEQQSNYAAISPIFQPIACIFSSFLIDKIGRKYGLILLCLPHVGTWFFCYLATSPTMLYVSSAFIGLCIGFLEVSSVIFLSECIEPRLRGIFSLFVALAGNGGMMILMYLSMHEISWRTMAIICPLAPVLIITLLIIVPESPVWLLSRNKMNEAESALCWFRGWVPKDMVKNELEEIRKFSKKYPDEGEDTRGSISKEFGKLREPTTLRPLKLLLCYSFFGWAAPSMASDKFLLIIYKNLEIPKGECLTIRGLITAAFGLLMCTILISKLGKRLTSLISISSCSLISISIGISIYAHNSKYAPFYIYEILFILRFFVSCTGVIVIPIIMLGEIIPMKSRGIAPAFYGIAVYSMHACFSKTYHPLEQMFGVGGCFIMYGLIGSIGIVYLYMYLPETELKSLAQIEEIFNSDKMHKHFFNRPNKINDIKMINQSV